MDWRKCSAGRATPANALGPCGRDDIAAILAEAQGQQPEESPLAGFSDQELIAELERRGYTVFRCGIDSGTGAELIYRVSRLEEGEK